MDSIRKTAGNVLVLDGGDFFHRTQDVGEPISRLAWGEMARLRYDAVTLGALELQQWALTKQLLVEQPLPVVCTNVLALRDGQWKPVGEPYRIVTIHGVRVGLLGVISDTQMPSTAGDDAANEIRILSPVEEIRRVTAQLRSRVDLLVLIAHVDQRLIEQYASLLPEIDVIVGGHVTRKDEGPVEIGGTIVNRSGTRGQHVASTRLIVAPNGEIVDFGGINVTLSPDFPEDDGVLLAVREAESASSEMRVQKNERIRAENQQRMEERRNQMQENREQE